VLRQLEAVAPTLPYDTRVMAGFEAPVAELGKITVPSLIMGGSKAKPNMTRAVQDVADAVPGSVRKTLAGQTHQVKNEAIAPEIVEFFR